MPIMVGRPRKVELDVALELALEAFWSKGYEATSMSDLVAATGLLKGSLYQNFGDKHALFCEALTLYLDKLMLQHRGHLSSDKPLREKLRDALQAMIQLTKGEAGQSRGCMAINTLVENSGHDPVASEILERYHQKIIELFLTTIEQAVHDGVITPVYDPERTTMLLMAFMTGLTINFTGPLGDIEQTFALLEQQLDLLGL